MFDIGMSELLVIGVVALIVVGPKDLPGMFRTLGRFTARARSMAREFSRAMEQAADEAGVTEAKNALNAAANPRKFGLDKLNEAAESFESWDPMKSGAGTPPPAADLDENRAAMAKAISESAARKATERKAAEAAEEAAKTANAQTAEPAPAPKAPGAKKAAAPKAAAKKAPAKKAPAQRAPAKKTPKGDA